jgi:hypothetical protein
VKHYEIWVRGGSRDSVAAAFEDLDVQSSPEGLRLGGWLDQAGLFGVLARIKDLGLELISTEVLDS